MGITVVFCDDGADIRDYAKAALRGLGHDVVGIGESGHDAVRLCQELQPDLALLDLSMGDLSGLEAAKQIIASGSTTKVLIMSSMAQVKDDIEKLGFAFIAKPIHRLQLGTKIDSLFKE